MACIRERRGRYVLDYRDKWGKRRWLTYPLTEEGLAAAALEEGRIKSGLDPGLDPTITLGRYITDHWLPVIRKRVSAQTLVGQEIDARVHIPDNLKRAPIRSISRAQIKRYLATLGEDHGLANSTVAKVARTVRSIFESALDDELLTANPTAGLRLALRLGGAEKVRAFDRPQLDSLLGVLRLQYPREYSAFAVLAFAGLRIGELRGLQVGDLDLQARTLYVERQVYEDGTVGPTKTRRPRLVDVADPLASMLEDFLSKRREYAMRTGSRSPWLLLPDWPVAPSATHSAATTFGLRRALARALEQARIPSHFTPHSLRHTYARLMLEGGEELLYVSRQLGHAGIGVTADLYGQWARVKPRAGGANLLGKAQD